MKLTYVSLILLVYVVSEIQSERTRSGMCKGCHHEEYTRIKRAKYYPSPPLRYYNRPPMTYPIKGAFSFTPPPGFLMDDGRKPQNLKPKVSYSRPTNEGLGDEDINNIVKFLSKQDLDKIVEFANEKERESSKYNTELLYEKPNYITNKAEKYESKVIYNGNTPESENYNKFLYKRPFSSTSEDFRPYSIEYNNNPNVKELKGTKSVRNPEIQESALFINKNKLTLNTQFDSDRVLQNQHFSTFDAYAPRDPNENIDGANIFSDSSLTQEEQLPKPSNIREDEYEVSYSNNVPTVVKAHSESYKIENLGALPLMNYHSKLDTVDSYRVPHYTVTSSEKYRASESSMKIPVEPAPPVSTAQEQSDAHLKATKIWTHKSKGTAYTLHEDGTLSLEKPSRPKTSYSYK